MTTPDPANTLRDLLDSATVGPGSQAGA